MKTLPRIATLAALVLASAVLVSCGGESPQDQAAAPAGTLQIKGAGATFPAPLYQKWIDLYREENPDVAFSYDAVGSGEGIERFVAGEVDFGASDAAMTNDQIAQVERGVKLIPATAGMVVLAYNLPGIEGELRLTRDVYVDIFRGKVWRWDDERIAAANPQLDLPPKMIQTVVRRDSSGTTYAFTNHLSAVSEAWRQDGPGTGKNVDWPGGAMTGSGNEGVAQKVKISVGSIGYMEYGFARRLGLPMAVLENKAGEFVAPGAESGRSALAQAATENPDEYLRIFAPDPGGAGSYPIVTLSWILLYGQYPEPEKAQALQDALTWGLTEGQPIAEEMGYIPLPGDIVAPAREALAKIR